MKTTREPLVLKARTVTDLLDAAVGLYRHNFGTLLGVVALVNGPLLALQVVASSLRGWTTPAAHAGSGPAAVGTMAMMGATLAVSLLMWAVQVVFSPLAAGAMVLSVSDLYMGRPVTVLEAYRRARPYWGSLIGAQILIGLIVAAVGLGPGLVLFGVGAALLAAKAAVAGGVVMGLAGLVMIYLVVAASLYVMATIPAIVVENRTVSDALGRSFRLVSRGWKHALAAWVLLGLFVAIPLVLAYAPGVVAELRGEGGLNTALATAIASLATLLLMPVTLAGQVVIYYDLRVRQEGFDVEVMAANLGLKGPGAPSLPPPAPPPPPGLAGGGGPTEGTYRYIPPAPPPPPGAPPAPGEAPPPAAPEAVGTDNAEKEEPPS